MITKKGAKNHSLQSKLPQAQAQALQDNKMPHTLCRHVFEKVLRKLIVAYTAEVYELSLMRIICKRRLR